MSDQRLLSTVYTSTATEPFDDAGLSALLTQSRDANAAAGITGLLLYRDGRFIQFLEGPERAVRELLIRIAADRRHRRFRILLEDHVDHRQFAEWTMGYHTLDGSGPTPTGFRESFDDLNRRDDPSLMAHAARELTMWYRRCPGTPD